MSPRTRLITLHLPGLAALLIAVAFSAEWEVFRPLKTEHTLGWWLVVLVPAAVALGLAQLLIWVVLAVRRAGR